MITKVINGSYYIYATSLEEVGRYGHTLFQWLTRNHISVLPAGTMLIHQERSTMYKFAFQLSEDVICDLITKGTKLRHLAGSEYFFGYFFETIKRPIYAGNVRLPLEAEAMEYEENNRL